MADIRHLLDKIRKAIYGKEVRGSLADGLEAVNNEVEDATEVAVNVEHRQDAVEQQFNTLLGEWSDDKPIDNAETIAARTNTKESKTYENLGKRLDEEYGKVTEQLAETEQSQFRDSMVSHKYLKPAIVWIDDDGKKGVYDRLYPLFKSKGKVFTSALITANVGRRESDLTLEQILEMRDSGVVEFCSHSHYHGQQGKPRPIEATETELYDDFKKTTDFLKQYGLNHRAYVQPFGQSNTITKKVERNFFNCSFRTEGTRQLNPPTLPFDMYDIERFGLGEDLSFIKSKMDEAVANNSFLTLVTHIDEFEVTDEKIIEIMDYADSIGIEFITVSEMVNRFGNLAQFGNTMIGANGKIVGNDFTNVITGTKPNDFEANAPITDFKVDKITYVKVKNTQASAYGLPVGGLIEVHRNRDDVYSYQKFTPNHSREFHTTLFRNWDNELGDWQKWRNEGAVDLYNGTQYETNAPITSFPREEITYVKVKLSEAEVYGVPTSGLIKVHRDREDAYSYQKFVSRVTSDGNPVLYRNWNHVENKWRKWVNVLGDEYVK